ncbi:hypothetical protein [Paenibacillus apis]|uniref:Uncharacterized protein n=1 Tax=Paenibacillus apis TaxID=1792174 RepID=A0A919Y219_9BACL|nr:hypothetical protein [Paenibacillus apis]GIO42299.1 hypothetical protein J41TS4_20570 [Paenibacillus apis]
MKLHLVFDLSILTPLVGALEGHGHSITGTDVTLEQFAVAASAGQVDAEIAIVDGGLGVIRRQDCVTLLKEVRMRVPDMRLIVILPELDSEWQRSLGMYGIYDVYAAEQFGIEDIQKWIQTKKTLADIPGFSVDMPELPQNQKNVTKKVGFSLEKNKGKIQTLLADWTKGFKRSEKDVNPDESESIEAESHEVTEHLESLVDAKIEEVQEHAETDESKKPVLQPEPQPNYQVSQPFIVAVGGLANRSGNTHTAIQIAYETASKGLKTAFVEYRNRPRPSDIVSFATDFDGLKFKCQGIDFFPNRSPFDVTEVYTLGYDSVILDLGVLVDENEDRLEMNSAAQEFLRCQFQFITLSAAPWDLHYIVQHLNELSVLLRKSSFIINYADEDMIKEFREMFPAITSIMNPLEANPFTDSGELAYWLERPKEKRKRWFVQ